MASRVRSATRSTGSTGRSESENCLGDAAELLKEHRIACKRVIRVLSAAEGFRGHEAVLYLNTIGRPRTAVLMRDPEHERIIIDIKPGWPV